MQNCRDANERKASKARFAQVKTWQELIQLWVQFYEDKVCLPTYLATWTQRNDVGMSKYTQDIEAALSIGQQLAHISLCTRILFNDGQAGTPQQRAYLCGFTTKTNLPMVRALTAFVNRQSGFVMTWWHDSNPKDAPKNRLNELFVTYDGENGFTRLPNTNDAIAFLLDPRRKYSWISREFQLHLKSKGMIGLFIMDANYNENSLIDLLELFCK